MQQANECADKSGASSDQIRNGPVKAERGTRDTGDTQPDNRASQGQTKSVKRGFVASNQILPPFCNGFTIQPDVQQHNPPDQA
jgi:hypothetical protein